MYKCKKCNEEFNAAHKNWIDIVKSQTCPNPKCRTPLPDSLLPQFLCKNCNKIRPSNKVAKINPLSKLIFSIYRRHVHIQRVCSNCGLQANFFGLFMFTLFAWYFYSMTFGSRASEIVCNKAASERGAIVNHSIPLKAKIIGIVGAGEVNFYKGPHTACKVNRVIVNEGAYFAVYKSHNGWNNVMHRGVVGWVPQGTIEIVGKYGRP